MPILPRLDRVSDTEGEHSDDSAGEKEAKRQRSEPTTPVSTSGRLPYEYDAVMGITKVGTKEVEGFGEELDTSEYHDATEEPTRRDESDNTVEPQRLSDFQGGYGSSSLKECIELLNTTSRIAPAPLDSGDDQKDATPATRRIRAEPTAGATKIGKRSFRRARNRAIQDGRALYRGNGIRHVSLGFRVCHQLHHSLLPKMFLSNHLIQVKKSELED